MNHYEVLGVPMGADPAEIRRAYLRLARRHHPDRHVTDDAATQRAARSKMAELNGAWEVLGEPARRRSYDEEVRRGTAGTGARWGGHGATVVGPSGPGWRPRSDDTGWMRDFDAWKNERDELPSDDPYPGRSRPPRSPLMVLPVALFVCAVAVGCAGLAMSSRGLLAVSFVGVAVSAALFVMLPMIVMTRSREDR